MVILSSCRDNTVSVIKSPKLNADNLMEINKNFANAEAKFVATMVDSLAIPAVQDSLGYWYWTYYQANQIKVTAKYKDQVKVQYTLCLLEGDTIYSKENIKEKIFVVGMSEIESGLHHAVKHLSVGDKAKIILPSHLAFGTYGDGADIPAKASLLYDIELIEIHSE
jgi:FKBP-type peptidyl-prolyl cis-trans isomerase FkpA